MAPKNHVLDGGQDRTNPFAAVRSKKSAMRPFAKLLWTLVYSFSCRCVFIITVNTDEYKRKTKLT